MIPTDWIDFSTSATIGLAFVSKSETHSTIRQIGRKFTAILLVIL